MKRTALLAGATGLVGGHCLRLLLENDLFERVVTIARSPIETGDPKHVHHVIDFDRISDYRDLIQCNDVFCCLGTTMKKAGSKEAFRKVDYHYPVALGETALANGADHYLLVSSIGADPGSSVFYLRVKGETEQALRALSYHSLSIFRPSLLTGERKEKRPGERFTEQALDLFSFLLRGPLRVYRPVEAKDVAAAMVWVAVERPVGVNVYDADRIRALAAS